MAGVDYTCHRGRYWYSLTIACIGINYNQYRVSLGHWWLNNPKLFTNILSIFIISFWSFSACFAHILGAVLYPGFTSFFQLHALKQYVRTMLVFSFFKWPPNCQIFADWVQEQIFTRYPAVFWCNADSWTTKSPQLNSLAPGRSEFEYKNVIFNLVLLIGIFRSSHDNALWWMPQDLTDMSTLVQVMAWCHQATSHYLS